MNKIIRDMKELKTDYYSTCYCEQYACKLENPFKDNEVAMGYCKDIGQYFQKIYLSRFDFYIYGRFR